MAPQSEEEWAAFVAKAIQDNRAAIESINAKVGGQWTYRDQNMA
jgi:hypothetical protein